MPLAPVPGVQPDFRFVNASGETSPYTTAIAKHAIQMQDPAFEPHNAKRNVPQERSGAAVQQQVSNVFRFALTKSWEGKKCVRSNGWLYKIHTPHRTSHVTRHTSHVTRNMLTVPCNA